MRDGAPERRRDADRVGHRAGEREARGKERDRAHPVVGARRARACPPGSAAASSSPRAWRRGPSRRPRRDCAGGDRRRPARRRASRTSGGATSTTIEPRRRAAAGPGASGARSRAARRRRRRSRSMISAHAPAPPRCVLRDDRAEHLERRHDAEEVEDEAGDRDPEPRARAELAPAARRARATKLVRPAGRSTAAGRSAGGRARSRRRCPRRTRSRRRAGGRDTSTPRERRADDVGAVRRHREQRVRLLQPRRAHRGGIRPVAAGRKNASAVP